MDELKLTVKEARTLYSIMRFVEEKTTWIEYDTDVNDLDVKVSDFLRETGDLVATSWDLT